MKKSWTVGQRREARLRRFVETNRDLIEALMDRPEFSKAIRDFFASGPVKIGQATA